MPGVLFVDYSGNIISGGLLTRGVSPGAPNQGAGSGTARRVRWLPPLDCDIMHNRRLALPVVSNLTHHPLPTDFYSNGASRSLLEAAWLRWDNNTPVLPHPAASHRQPAAPSSPGWSRLSSRCLYRLQRPRVFFYMWETQT